MTMTMHGVTWTVAGETEDMYEKFAKRWPGVEISMPQCERERCGATTCYIVERISPMRKGMAPTLLGRFEVKGPGEQIKEKGPKPDPLMSYFRDGDNLYIPVRLCHRCSAADAGYQVAWGGMTAREWVKSLDGMPYTDAEKREMEKVFSQSVAKHMDLRESQAQQYAAAQAEFNRKKNKTPDFNAMKSKFEKVFRK